MRTIIINTPSPQGQVGPQGNAGPTGSSAPFDNVSGSIWATTSSLEVSGSFTVSGSSTFTNIGPAVFSGSINATSGVTMSSALVSGDVTVLGTASINVLQINTTINSTGSNTLGDAANDTQTLFGSVVIPTGSLTVSGSTQITGSLTMGGSIFTSGYIGYPNNSRYLQFNDADGLVRLQGFSGIRLMTYNTTGYTDVIKIDGNVATRTIQVSGSLRVSGSTQITGSLEVSSAARFNGDFNLFRTDGIQFLNVSNAGAAIDFNPGNNATPTFRVRGTSGVLLHIKANEDKVGINNTAPTAMLHVRGSGTTSATTALRVENTNASASLVVLDNGFVGINTGSAQYNLDVNGTARVGDTLIQGSGNTSGTTALSAQNSNGTIMFSVRNDRVIRLLSRTDFGNVQFYPINDGAYTVASNATQLRMETSFVSGTTTGDFGFSFGTFSAQDSSNANVKSVVHIGSFAPTSGTKTYTTTEIRGTINQTGGANGITRGLYVNPTLTSAADFRAIETNAGNVLFQSGSTPLLFVSSSGFVGVGTTTDAGFKLDVNGTARVTGAGSTSATTSFIVRNSVGTTMLSVKDGGSDKVVTMPSAVVGQFDISGTIIQVGSGNSIRFVAPNGFAFNTSYASPDASAQVDIASTTKGFLPPRMTNAQRLAISTPAVGLMVYCTDATEGLYIYKSAGWTFIV